MKYKDTFFSLLNTYLLFGLIYSGIIWLIWNFLFVSITGISLSFLQVFGLYVITRILVGNSSTQYVSNFYSPKPFDMNELDNKFNQLKEEFGDSEIEVEDRRNDKRD
jgi:hypothetical protein